MPNYTVFGVSRPAGVPESARPADGQWCDRHWKPIRAGVEAGTHDASQAMALLMSELLRDEQLEGRLGGRRDTARLRAAVTELAPFCCHLGDGKMQEITVASRRRRPDRDAAPRA